MDCHIPKILLVAFLSLFAAAAAQAQDSDGDGLSDSDELTLGTDPENVDSDCDNLHDAEEVGGNVAVPLDGDSDGLIDALESRYVDSDGDDVVDSSDSTTSWQLSCGKFHPFAVTNDQSTSARIEVRVEGGASISGVYLRSSQYVGDVLVDGVAVDGATGVQLYDDGSNGDRVAGDRIYTRDNFTSNTFSQLRDRAFDQVHVVDNSGANTLDLDAVVGGSFDRFELMIIDPDYVETPTSVASNAQTTSHLINLVEPLLSLEVKKRLASEVNSLQMVSQAFYQVFDDDYDLLMFFPDSSHVKSGAFGVHSTVQNDTQGLGVSIFDSTASWGSAGRLQSAIVRNFADNGPMLHEFAHRWGIRLDSSLGFQQCTGGHSGWAGIGRGQLGGFDPDSLVDLGGGLFEVDAFGSFANGGDSVPYVPIELYLMGLVGPEAVPNMLMPVSPDCGSLVCAPSGCSRYRFNAASVGTVTINDVMATEGARNPDHTTSQRAFFAGMVIVSQRVLTDVEMAFFNAQAIGFGNASGVNGLYSFESATGHEAAMLTRPNGLFEDEFEAGDIRHWAEGTYPGQQ